MKTKILIAAAAIAAIALLIGGLKYHRLIVERVAEERREAPEPVSQRQRIPKLKEIVERYEDGARKSARHVLESNPQIREGLASEYYRNGKPRSEMNYSDNVPSGRFCLYSEDGALAMEGTLKNGLRDGRFTEWHPGGRVKIECGYKNGVLDGAWVEYYDADGSPKKIEAQYLDGAPVGRYAVYKIDGLVKEERIYGQLPVQAGSPQQGEVKTPPHDCSDTPISDSQGPSQSSSQAPSQGASQNSQPQPAAGRP